MPAHTGLRTGALHLDGGKGATAVIAGHDQALVETTYCPSPSSQAGGGGTAGMVVAVGALAAMRRRRRVSAAG